MKRLLLIVAIGTLLIVSAKTAYGLSSPVLNLPTSDERIDSREEIISLISVYSFLYNVDTELALYVAEKESSFDPGNVGDMDIIKNGKPVRARGLWQITEFYHQNISDEQAFDSVWSTIWAMKYLKDEKKCVRMWTTCSWFYKDK